MHDELLLCTGLQADTLDKNFEKPLRQHLETYKTIVNVRTSLLVICK